MKSIFESLLPNCRFLSLESEHLGRDWAHKSQEIDAQLDNLGLDLAEESVYLIYNRAPGSVLANEALCQIARSVIGPKKDLAGPLFMSDWSQSPVHRKSLKGPSWPQILQECYSEWESLQRQGQKVAAPFMIVAKRRLVPELSFTLEVVFHG